MSASVQINDTGSTVAVTIQDAQVLVGVPTVVAHNDLTGRSAADAHPASAITNTPAGGVSATTVQTAINELDTEKAPLASPALSGVPTAPTAAPDTNTTQIATCAFAKAEADAAQAASQPLDAELTALASTTSAADKVPYFTGTGTATTADFTAAGRALVDDSNAAAQLATLGIPLLATTGITGILTLSKSGTTARTATFPDADITVARIDAAQTFTGKSTFTDGINSTHCDAADVSGMHIGNNAHQDVAMFGAGGGQGTTLYGQLNCLAVDSTSANGILTRQASTQDAIKLLGRAGGSNSYAVTITPTTLTASRTLTLPDASIIAAGSASALTSGRVPYATTGGLLVDSAEWTSSPASAVAMTLGTNARATALYQAMNAAAGYVKGLAFQSAGLNRWIAQCYSTAESGGNAGSPFYITAFDDAGSTIDSPVTITRAAGGAITLARPVSITNTTASTSTTTGSLVVAGGLGIAKEIVSTASSAGAHYWGPTGTDGSVRMYGDGSGNMIFEKRASGSWTEIGRFTA